MGQCDSHGTTQTIIIMKYITNAYIVSYLMFNKQHKISSDWTNDNSGGMILVGDP